MYSVFRDLAIIILSAKFFGLVARKCRAPQVVGEIIAGLLIGPCLLNLVQTNDTISTFAEIGVVLLMFTTGLGTNLKELLRAGPIATLIACVGVLVPLVGGTLLYSRADLYDVLRYAPFLLLSALAATPLFRDAMRAVCRRLGDLPRHAAALCGFVLALAYAAAGGYTPFLYASY